MALDAALMAQLSRPDVQEPTRIAVLADPHLSTRAELTTKLYDRTRSHLETAVRDMNERDLDAVVSVGDLTKDGEPWNVDAFDEIIDGLEPPFMSVPGNHDVPKASDEHEAPSVGAFADRFAPGEYPFVNQVGGVDVVGLNTAGSAEFLYGSHDGGIPVERREVVEAALDRATDPVVFMHHNLPAMYDRVRRHRDTVDREMHVPPTMRDGEEIASLLSAAGVPLVLTGHLHLPATTVQDGVREVMAPTTCSFPQGYLLLDMDTSGTAVRFVPVADRDGLRFAHAVRSEGSPTSRGLTAMASVNLARFPLVSEDPGQEEANHPANGGQGD